MAKTPNCVQQFLMFNASYASSFIPRLERFSRRENWEDSEFDQFKSCTQGPDFSCQALAEGLKENSTLTDLDLFKNSIGPEGAKAWCLVEDGRQKKGIEEESRHSHVKVKSVKCSRALQGMHCKVDLCWSQCCKSIDAPCSSLVVLWWSDLLGFRFFLGKYLSRAVSEQMWENLMLNETHCIPKPSIPHPLVEQPEKFPRRKGGMKRPRVWSNFSCQALAEGLKDNSTLKNLDLHDNKIADEGAKAWCLVEDGVGRKGAAGFHRKNQDMRPFESKV